MSDTKKAQHREFVQTVITRMNTNSFQIKSMAITIIGAFLAIYASNLKNIFIVLPIPITCLFWFLDAYYLQLERKFRGIYNDICDLTDNNNKTIRIFEMDTSLYKNGKYSFWKVLLSSSLTVFYLVIILSLITVYYVLQCTCL